MLVRIDIPRCDDARRRTNDWHIRKLIVDRVISPDMRNCLISYCDGCVFQDFPICINGGNVATSYNQSWQPH